MPGRANGVHDPGTQTQIWDCSGAANQTWTRTTSATSSPSPAAQLCLDASDKGTSPGTKVITWTCNGQTNQQWNVNANGTITSAQSGLCLDVTGRRHRQRHPGASCGPATADPTSNGR